MTTAQAPAPGYAGDDEQILDAAFRLAARLRDDLYVTVATADLRPGTIADWNDVTRTLTVRATASHRERCWAYLQLWTAMMLGVEHATGVDMVRPNLTLVPAPRGTVD